MSTSIVNGAVTDSVLTELLAVLAVATAFPVTTLAGAALGRMTIQHKLLMVTPANVQLKDEQGDVLALYFLSQTGNRCYFTQKGKARFELEAAQTAGY